MSKSQRTSTKHPKPNAYDLLVNVESVCSRAGDLMRATAQAVTGAELRLNDEAGPLVYGAALEHVAGELDALSDRALKARTGGQS